MKEKDRTSEIIGAAIEVHRHLGPGLLESVYEESMVYELESRGFQVDRQKELPVEYKGKRLDAGYRIDLLINNEAILELKSVKKLSQSTKHIF